MSAQGNQQTGEPPRGVSFTFSYKELIATGLAGSLLAFLASKWHVSGVLLGALSPMASMVIMAIVKAYLSGAVLDGRGWLHAILYVLGSFWWFASRSAEMRQSILLEGLRAGLAASVISAGTVVGTQTIVGKDLTCLIWEECHRGIFPPRNGPPPSNESARAVGVVANSGRVGGGGFALLGASVLLGSGILSLAIMRRRS